MGFFIAEFGKSLASIKFALFDKVRFDMLELDGYNERMKGFYIGSLHISWYGVIIAFAMIVAIFLCVPNCKKRDLKIDNIVSLALWVIPFAIIGARLYYVIFYTHDYTFVEALRIWDGGMAIYGGVIAGAIVVVVWCLIKKKDISKTMDVIAPSVLLAQAIGRIGCYFSSCCYGIEVTNEKLMWFPLSTQIDGVWHLSTFFYESLWNLVGFAILMILLYFIKQRGVVVSGYLIWYGIGRAWIEGLRGDSLYLWGTGIRVSQLLSILIVVGGLVWLGIIIYKDIIKKKYHINKGDKNGARKEQSSK